MGCSSTQRVGARLGKEYFKCTQPKVTEESIGLTSSTPTLEEPYYTGSFKDQKSVYKLYGKIPLKTVRLTKIWMDVGIHSRLAQIFVVGPALIVIVAHTPFTKIISFSVPGK
ncbi:putative Protein shisa-5-like protein, partial [Naja naja]